MCGGWRSRGYAPSLWKAARISVDVAERFSPSVARPDIKTVSVSEGCRFVVHPELFGENPGGKTGFISRSSLAYRWMRYGGLRKARFLKTVFHPLLGVRGVQ